MKKTKKLKSTQVNSSRPKKVAENKGFLASIKVLGKVYQSKGDSVKEAINNLQVPKGRGMSILTVSNGKISKDRVLPAVLTMRLFSLSPLMREISLKQTSLLFEGLFT